MTEYEGEGRDDEMAASWIAIQDRLSDISNSINLLSESHDELLVAAKEVVRTFPLSLEQLMIAIDALKVTIANAEKLP